MQGSRLHKSKEDVTIGNKPWGQPLSLFETDLTPYFVFNSDDIIAD